MLFINPAATNFGGFLSRYVPVGIPVAIGSLSAYLEKFDIRCRVLDEEIIRITPEVLREKVDGLEAPYVFGLSCLTAHVARGYELAKMIKTEFPDATVVFGGLHPTTLPEEALATGYVDFVVRGEGEEVMLHLYRAIRGSGDPTELKGVSYIRDGQYFHNAEAPLIPDINQIPAFPYHLFQHPRYDMGFLATSRGCPYRCSYCSQRLLTGTTYRYKSAEKIMEELEILVETYGQKTVVFYDDNFCLKARRVHELCDLIIERGMHKKVEFSIQTRADNMLIHGGEKLIRHMVEAGFRHAGFGMETGVQRLADLIRKDETVDVHLETTRLCQKNGMTVSLFMIYGLPTETSDDREESYRVVGEANVVGTKYNNLIPYPGTPLWNELKDSGRLVINENWHNFNSTLAMTTSIFDKTPLPYVPDTCSEWELKRDIIRYNLKSFINVKSVLSVLRRKTTDGWFKLPEGWFYKPRELFEVAKIAAYLTTNIVLTYSPLWLTEPLMTALNPNMKNRVRIANYNPETYETVDWDKIETKRKTLLLKEARDQQRESGSFNILVKERAVESVESEKATAS